MGETGTEWPQGFSKENVRASHAGPAWSNAQKVSTRFARFLARSSG